MAWSKDITKAEIADNIEAGTIYINNYFNAAAQSPVGGYKQSGYGRENGWEGMRCFMQTKSVWLSTNLISKSFLRFLYLEKWKANILKN